MMTEQREGQEAFQSFLWSLYGQIDPSESLQKLRAKAWEPFLGLGLPTPKEEAYRYIGLKNLFLNRNEPSQLTDVLTSANDPDILRECRQSVLVFINGRFSLQ